MAAKITREILESYLHCKFKGHLKLTRQQGIKSDYEALLTERRNIPLTTSALKQGASFLLDAALEDDLVSLVFDGLKKVGGLSNLGDFHYIPMLFHEGKKVHKEQKLLLELYGLFLASLQGRSPDTGIVWHGKECNITRVRLNTDKRKIERFGRDLKSVLSVEALPKLILNDHCRVCEFQKQCHAQAAQEDNISLLRGLGEKEITKYAKKGLFTVTQLAYTFRPRRRRRKRHNKIHLRNHSLQAMAIRDKTTYVTGTLELPTNSLQVYLDVEGLPDSNLYYLIGVYLCDDSTEKHIHFWADSEAEEAIAWKGFLDLIGTLEDFTLFHYGSYESRFISSMGKKYGIPSSLQEKLEANCINTLSKLYAQVYLPIYSNDLKSAATFLGFRWSAENASGIQSIVWRSEWERSRSDALKRKLISYNQEDCQALRIVTDTLRSIASKTQVSRSYIGSVIQAEDLKREHPYGFGRNEFFFPELALINKCAYFDYQRERIYVRTSRAVKDSVKREKRRHRAPRINKTISCALRDQCEVCLSDEVIKHGGLSKVVYDMKLFVGGIKRWVVRYTSSRCLCKTCGKTFVPISYQSKTASKYGHTLLAWSVYRNIELRQSHGTITHELAEVFGYEFGFNIAARLKATASRYYESTYANLANRLRNGILIHADETKVSIKGLEGYVWAFTNLQEVIYIYSDTRDGHTPCEALNGFAGILVSDFYAAYDAINCIQQKCLIHLIRDINDDLFKNPFDEELKTLARDFTTTLTPIIDTIDKHGLQKYHLNKHRIPAQRFLDMVSTRDFTSPLAKNYQRRINKNREKLFVFLEHDGVPWNNNNAEHAIKRFAFLRKVIGGSSTAKGIKEYLVLLSVCETLRLRGLRVLKFLMSGAVDIDAFAVTCET
jgi:predicted RecB family nuclease